MNLHISDSSTMKSEIMLLRPSYSCQLVWQVLVFAGSNGKNVFLSVVDFINGFYPTPLVRLDRFGDVWAKLEFFNPLSRSIKDRTVQFLLRKYLNNGLSGHLVFEASSGNVAISLAALANVYGFRYRAYATKHLPETTEVLLKVLGAEVVRVDRDMIDEEFWRWVSEEAVRNGAINLNQFENVDNPEVIIRLLVRKSLGNSGVLVRCLGC